ncbi:uncharacterized protein LOC112091193 [Morus notabilis]|uniref:uncharacterized protein LOC112091193 n=1 Tax=Morus notabilis TaxID=981085 RepID=UPI000CED0AF5|nr:uncharacterized protein LOC112091193 [Morus notabilis]
MALKLDMSKAYDRVEWSFLGVVMDRLWFSAKWIDRVMDCVLTTSFSFLVNGRSAGKVTPYRGLRIKETLETYEKASGQVINFQKSSVCFSPNLDDGRWGSILEVLNLPHNSEHDSYLGLPSVLGQNKKRVFDKIREQVWRNLQMLEGKFLSVGGRKILIKAVAQAATTNAMIIPSTLCDNIQSLISKFSWGGCKEDRKIHQMRWSLLCRAKGEGGLGFRDMEGFNKGLVIAMQGWHIVTCPNSFMARILKAKYFTSSSSLDVPVGYNPSSTPAIKDLKVSDLLQGFRWELHMIEDTFWDVDRDVILEILMGSHRREDFLVWHFDDKGNYSVRSGYQVEMECRDVSSSSGVWIIDGGLVYGSFGFLIRAHLVKHRVKCSSSCPRCGEEMETASHPLWYFPAALEVWMNSAIWTLVSSFSSGPFAALCLHAASQAKEEELDIFCMITWSLLLDRNGRVFANKAMAPVDVVNRVRQVLSDYLSVLSVDSRAANVPTSAASNWRPPVADVVKIKVDANVHQSLNAIGLGVVIRDKEGIVFAAIAKRMDRRFSPHIAECFAARKGVVLAERLGFHEWILVLDAINVVRAIQGFPRRGS